MLVKGIVKSLPFNPRNIEELLESMCQEASRFLTPFGDDFEEMPMGTRLTAGECIRRLSVDLLPVRCRVHLAAVGVEEAAGHRV